jgi:hypothetical protein
MIQFPHFLQECPVCGRPAQVRRKYLGQRVVCHHCQGSFVAIESHEDRPATADCGGRLIGQANLILEAHNKRPAYSHG